MNAPFVIPASSREYAASFASGYRSSAIQTAIIRLEHGDTAGALEALRGATSYVIEGDTALAKGAA